MCKEQEFLYPVNTRMNLSLILTVIRTQRTSETALVFHHHLSLLHYLYSVASVLIWRPRCSDSSAGRQLGKAPQCITTINRQLEYNDTRTGPLYCGFTLKNDDEMVGQTKHRDHTHARVCSRCLWSNKEDELSQQQIAGFLFI